MLPGQVRKSKIVLQISYYFMNDQRDVTVLNENKYSDFLYSELGISGFP